VAAPYCLDATPSRRYDVSRRSRALRPHPFSSRAEPPPSDHTALAHADARAMMVTIEARRRDGLGRTVTASRALCDGVVSTGNRATPPQRRRGDRCSSGRRFARTRVSRPPEGASAACRPFLPDPCRSWLSRLHVQLELVWRRAARTSAASRRGSRRTRRQLQAVERSVRQARRHGAAVASVRSPGSPVPRRERIQGKSRHAPRRSSVTRVVLHRDTQRAKPRRNGHLLRRGRCGVLAVCVADGYRLSPA
jgi:hypothetical protein